MFNENDLGIKKNMPWLVILQIGLLQFYLSGVTKLVFANIHVSFFKIAISPNPCKFISKNSEVYLL